MNTRNTFIKMHVMYDFTGKNLHMDKLERAVQLSEEQYCGVRAVYNQTMELTSEINVVEA
jgi:putative redox protein